MRAGGVALDAACCSRSSRSSRSRSQPPSILSRTIGLKGVWAAYPIVFCAMFVLQMGYYATGLAQAHDSSGLI